MPLPRHVYTGKHKRWKLPYKRKVKPFTAEHRRRMSESQKGQRVGVNNPLWRGEEAHYRSHHSWVVHWKGQPDKCEKCGNDGFSGQQIHWANIDHKYNRVLDDYIRMCAKCHTDYDRENGYRK